MTKISVILRLLSEVQPFWDWLFCVDLLQLSCNFSYSVSMCALLYFYGSKALYRHKYWLITHSLMHSLIHSILCFHALINLRRCLPALVNPRRCFLAFINARHFGNVWFGIFIGYILAILHLQKCNIFKTLTIGKSYAGRYHLKTIKQR